MAAWLGGVVKWPGGLAAWFRRLAEGRSKAASGSGQARLGSGPVGSGYKNSPVRVQTFRTMAPSKTSVCFPFPHGVRKELF
jgi:hypothetical protein